MTKTLTQKIVAIATTLTVTGMLAAPVYGLTTADTLRWQEQPAAQPMRQPAAQPAAQLVEQPAE